MKKIALPAVYLFVVTFSYAQDTLTKYFDANWKEITKDSAAFFQKKIKSGNDWLVSNYYTSGVLQMKGTFSNDSLSVPNGAFNWYNEKGVMKHSVSYKEGKADGLEIQYYDNGKKRTEGNYKMGKLEGDWVGYYETGKMSGKAHYTENEQNAGSFFNEDGTTNKSIKVFYRPAEYPGGSAALIRYLSQTLVYPPAAQKKEIQGSVVVEFKVKIDGTLTNIKIVNSVEPSLDKEAMRVIRQMPAWVPAINGGAYAEYYAKQPITFKLQ